MNGTKKTRARGVRAAVIGALGLAAVTLAAVPAFAKGDVDIAAPRTAHVGKTFTITAHGDDDSAGHLHQLCLEERTGKQPWHQETCSAVVGGEARVTAHGSAAHRGDLQFRAVLYGLTSKHDHHPVRLHASEVVTVRVR
ncbi:hypothetical protein FRZ03_32395 [Streptomyces misionensis]|uniref:Uncharacterized protein n=1 Tax=Streptomyces misionensis TaxID=67331 RepID=A0A5C6IWY5_9ACTN|nr:hypothetical protein [Streptomyces misionensis]TWV32855.1 hypothetical protein FRZ03_32395 [Streptomyces misionensis]